MQALLTLLIMTTDESMLSKHPVSRFNVAIFFLLHSFSSHVYDKDSLRFTKISVGILVCFIMLQILTQSITCQSKNNYLFHSLGSVLLDEISCQIWQPRQPNPPWPSGESVRFGSW